MTARKHSGKYIKFFVYLVVVVLVNLAGITLFHRWDLTQNKIYSLSDVSQKVVETLTEPLTIKVFFTKDLPAPYNATERYLRDLLDEYALHGKHFSYQVYNVAPQTEGSVPDENQKLAQSYGIQPVQIQQLEQDELKFKLAYMGLVIIHGDIVERLPTLTGTDGLEYRLTTAIQKMNHKISALLALSDKIQVKLFLSSSLAPVGPLLGIDSLAGIPDEVKEIVAGLNQKNYGRLEFSFQAPSSEQEQQAAAETYQAILLKWPELKEKNLAAGQGVVGLAMTYKDKTVSLPLLRILRLPVIGDQYQLATRDELGQMIGDQVGALVGINENIAYLSDHGTPSLEANRGSQTPALSTLNTLLGGTYSPKTFALADSDIPRDVKCLVIARPTEPFTDYELYQIDQALMRGQNLALFLEPFKEAQPGSGAYAPLDSGLEKLLAHWGVTVKKSIVMDENCYQQAVPKEYGGGEQPIYFAPILQSEHINQVPPFMRNIKEMIVLKAAPLDIDAKRMAEAGLSATVLLSSSNRSWEMAPPLNFDPLYQAPPAKAEALKSLPIACMIEGAFPSYFAGKPIPEKTASKKPDPPDAAAKKTPDAIQPTPLSSVSSDGTTLQKGKPAKIFLIGAGSVLNDDILDADGKFPNSMFIMNTLDALNDHEDTALMRSKIQGHNPLDELPPQVKTFVKAVNIAGLPILVVVFGLLVWVRRNFRKKAIQKMFDLN